MNTKFTIIVLFLMTFSLSSYAQKDVSEKSAMVRFKVTGKHKTYIIAWTTTPWTLPANQAVALHPDLEYVLVRINGKRSGLYVFAADLLDSALERYEVEDYVQLATVSGQALEGIARQHPFYDREVPVILGDHVTTEAGTGAVHTAPGHGQEDFVVGMKYKLPVENPVGGNGVFLPDTELFAGQHVMKANPQVVEVLKTKGTLVHEEALRHSYPHCWRHKTPIIFRATPQWFISMTKNGLRDAAMKEIEQTQWMPDWGKARIEGMVTNRPDWCISRQRTWGVPIPLFVHQQTGKLHPDTAALIEKVALLVEEKGIEAWFQLDSKELLGDVAGDYDKATDTLDVWFDSGVTHACVLDRRKDLARPADLYLEGSDQHRGWFQSSLLTSVAATGKAPYKAVLTHGFTVDAKGQKMSKSYGNTIPIFLEGKQLKKGVMTIQTDSTPVEEPKDPDACNLYNIFKLFAPVDRLAEVRKLYVEGGAAYGYIKLELVDLIGDYFKEAREKRAELLQDKESLKKILAQGAHKAGEKAAPTLDLVRKRVGLKY